MLNLETSGTRNCACVCVQDRFQLGRHVHCCRMSRNERVNGFNLETKSFCEEQPQNFNGLHNCSANFFRVFQGCMMVYVSTSPSTTFRPSFIPLIPRHCCTVCARHIGAGHSASSLTRHGPECSSKQSSVCLKMEYTC